MRKRKLVLFLISIITSLMLSSCENNVGITELSNTSEQIAITGFTRQTLTASLSGNCASHEESADYTWNSSDVITITLNGNSISSSGTGLSINGSKVTITSAGTYILSGTLNDGQIIVNTSDAQVVRLILNGVSIRNTTNAAISIEKAGKAVIVLADNTQNFVEDASSYVFPNADTDEPNAAVFSKSDLTIFGNGSLNVNANYNDGIASKDGLIIKSSNISINSVDDGIRGKDYLIVNDGNLTVKCTGDGLKSDNDSDSTRGYIYVEKGTFNVTAGGDAITADTDVLIKNGEFTLTTGGGSNRTVSSTVSAKGIKGIVRTIIDDGTFVISSADDAVHSNKHLAINGGLFTISSGDDGIHADATLGVYGGNINITKSYEGIESAALTINDGNIHIVSSDDGLNGAGGRDASGNGSFMATGNYYLIINGGYIVVNASGDGIDINGSITMTGGTVLVNGPTSNGDGPIDYDSSFKISGGFLVAAGSSGMAQAPGTSSTQYSVLLTFRSTFSANTLFHIQASDGSEILSFTPKKNYQSVAFSSPLLVKDSSYDVYYGGSSSGTANDGLFQSGTYTPGTKYTSFTISSIVTRITN